MTCRVCVASQRSNNFQSSQQSREFFKENRFPRSWVHKTIRKRYVFKITSTLQTQEAESSQKVSGPNQQGQQQQQSQEVLTPVEEADQAETGGSSCQSPDQQIQQNQQQQGTGRQFSIIDFVNLFGQSFTRSGLPQKKYKKIYSCIENSCTRKQWKIGPVRRENARIVAEVLFRAGISADNLEQIAYKRPNLFFVSLDMVYTKSRYFIKKLGLTNQQLCKLLFDYPRIFEYSLEDIYKPKVAYFKQIGLTKREIRTLIILQTNVLNHKILTLDVRLEFLKTDIGLNAEQLGRAMKKCPEILTYSINVLQRQLLYFQSKNLDEDELKSMVTKHPRVLHYHPETIENRCGFFYEQGFTEQEVWKMLANFPQIMCLSVEFNLEPKYKFWVEVLGYSKFDLLKYPAYFSLSLNKRLIPRYEFLVSLYQKRGVKFLKLPLYLFQKTEVKFLDDLDAEPDEFVDFQNQCLDDVGTN
eukprot:TRINITY_DN427_c1_g1_i7.p1 TRINITY_DN427_c1_g1~~TRINITY_DN427_c1_g1_i7.p1  ORF type:complete len:470 (-),score=42.65 TRINITY_DN427_c1_g1_i7:1660-3069(-)